MGWVVGGGVMGYIFVTREHWDGRYGVACAPLWITFCNPQMMEFCGVCGECVGYIFVTHKQWGGVLAAGVWVTSLQHANKGMVRYDVGCVRLWGYRIKAEHHVVLRFGLFIACLLK